jgi:hypothetical protein
MKAMGIVRMSGLLMVFAGCWTKPVAPPASTPTAIAEAPRRETTSEAPSRPRYDPSPPDDALTTQLRLGGGALATYVHGPIVVLDLDTASFVVHCGQNALIAAQEWGNRYADPMRQPPACVVHPSGARECIQFGASRTHAMEVLTLGITGGAQPRLASAIIGSDPKGFQLQRELDAQIAAAKCP